MNHSSHESFSGASILGGIDEDLPIRLARGVANRPALVLYKLGAEVLMRAEDPLAAIGLSGRQYMMLAVLDSDQPESQLALAQHCGLMPAQVVPVVDELEGRGLVERRRSDADRRRSVVRLTDAGRELLGRADALATTIDDALFDHLAVDERERLQAALRDALVRARSD
jgi:DNA-binding MarR family transcriptional regulator